MTRSEPGCVPRGKPLDRLLLATVGLPVLAFAWGTREGQVAFVLFREPKLALLQALGWSLLAALAWVQPGGLRAADAWGRLRRPPWALLALFLTWSLITALWVEVPHNLLYDQRILDWEEYPTVAQEITFTSEGGDWARRGPDGLSLTTAEAGAIVDANHDGTWEESSPLPGTTPDFVVGARAEACSCVQSVQAARSGKSAINVVIFPSQIEEKESLASHIVDPPTFPATSFPLHKDRDRDPEAQDGEKSAALQALPLISLGLLALALATLRWRWWK